MAVTFELPADRAVDLLRFAWSPLFESALSLRAVAQPKRTPMHLPWVRRCRELLPEEVHDEALALIRPFERYVPGVFEVGLLGDSPRFEDEIAAFRAIDDQMVAWELSLSFGGERCVGLFDDDDASMVHDPSYRDRVLDVATETGHLDLAQALFDDPAAVRDRYARLLERYWELAFADEWARLLPRIEAEVTDGARALVTGGPVGLVRELLPEGHWDAAASAIVVDKDWEGRCDVAARGGLLFVPTVYGWPCVLIELAKPWPLAVTFPLRDVRQPEVPHASDREVVEGLRALADETRLQIARLVAEDPRSTKELAELLSLSDSAISRHLKILQAAGVVTGERDGYFVLYRLVEPRLDVIGRALRSTLGLTQAQTGTVPALPVTFGRTPVG